MSDIVFHRCEMRHEEFHLSSNASEFSSTWKRNSLCPIAIRSRNFLCTHGTALQRFLRENEMLNADTRDTLSSLQNQLFLIDHQKGDLEKYVFGEDDVKPRMKEQLRRVIQEYHRVADQLETALSQLNLQTNISEPSG
jgi:hypothetical protein